MLTLRPILNSLERRKSARLPGWPLALPLFAVFLLAGCSRFHSIQHDYVYVATRQVYLHDRVAAVSNRVALVTNGQRLEIVERGKRFIKVSTDKKEIGWVEEHAVIDDKLYSQFQDLANKHRQDIVVATAQLKDDLFLHILPGREQEHFILVPENTRVQLLARGTVAKPTPPGALAPKPKPIVLPQPATTPPPKAKGTPPAPPAKSDPTPTPPPEAPPVIMEDWWLVRDAQGNTGWLISGRLDVELPDEVAIYAEGQRMVGAYPIAKVTDGGIDSEGKHAKKSKTGKAKEPANEKADTDPQPPPQHVKEITEFVTVLTPPHNGLPFDFDQVRLFTWSLNHHRYETGFRIHGIQGYLPVKISSENIGGQQFPVFSFQIANGPNVAIDPDTGAARPLVPRTVSFRLEGNIVKRTGTDLAPIQLLHPSEEQGAIKKQEKKPANKKH